MEQTMVTEIQNSEPTHNPDAQAMALTGDTNADLKAIAAELGVSPELATQPEKVAERAAVVKVEEKVEVPPKFQNPDGTVNVEKLEKSTVNVEAMVAKYRAKEKEAQTLQNRVNNPPPQANPPQQQYSVPQGLTPLETQVAQDILNETDALQRQGYQPAQAAAIATARVQVKLQEARYQAEVSATQDLRQKMEDQERSRELQGLIDSDPWLASDEATNALWEVRQQNPWINQAPKPWEAAYTFYKGRNGHTSQVQTPNPQGTTAKAPATPVGPVTRVHKTVDLSDRNALRSMDLNDLEAQAKKLFPGLKLK